MQTQRRPGFLCHGVQLGWSASARQALEKGRLGLGTGGGFLPVWESSAPLLRLSHSANTPQGPAIWATVPADVDFSHVYGALAVCVAPPPRPSLEIQEERGAQHVSSPGSWLNPGSQNLTLYSYVRKQSSRRAPILTMGLSCRDLLNF